MKVINKSHIEGNTLLIVLLLFSVSSVNAGDIIHVPMSWCVVEGSRAEASPNIGADNETDAVIWRRHERPTDNIYLPQADISLRSAINNAWSVLDFPIIADPDTSQGVTGDMRGEDVNSFGVEFNAMLNACDQAYNDIGRAGIGITVVNANLFHDASGSYIGIIGWAGCDEFPAGTCVSPYDGRVVVIDNAYLHPDSPDRTFPGGSNQFTATDPLDILTGHEVGHALSLNHRNNTTALMNPSISDNDSDGAVDNTDLNATEVASLRANALNVPGMELDPPNVFIPGDWLQQRIPDPIDDHNAQFRFMDMTSVKLAFNSSSKEFHVQLSLGDKLPSVLPDPPCDFWFLLDSDNNTGTGATNEQLRKLGLPAVGFKGADIILQASMVPVPGGTPALAQNNWSVQKKQLVQIPNNFRMQLRELAVYPQFAKMRKPNFPKIGDRHIAGVSVAWVGHLPETLPLGRTGRFNALIVQNGEVVDELNKGISQFVLDSPVFPHCFPQQAEVKQGETAVIDVEGLSPNSKIHGLLGPEEIFTDTTNGNGGGSFKLKVPVDTNPGPHLVTVGVIDTALTADCTLIVKDKGACDADLNGDNVVDIRDAKLFARDFKTPSCRGE